jgi:hypothetical protein
MCKQYACFCKNKREKNEKKDNEKKEEKGKNNVKYKWHKRIKDI